MTTELPLLRKLALAVAVAAAVLLVSLLALVRSAGAQTLLPGGPLAPLGGPAAAALGAHPPAPEEDEEEAEEDDESGGDEGEEDNRCASDDEAAEEACEERLEAEEEKELEEEELAEECRVEGAEATVAAVPARDQVRLTVRYSAFAPSSVAIALGLRGGKGRLDLGVQKAHFGREGTVHATKTVSDAQMARVLAAREFTVGVQAVNAPGFCRGLFERHLTARHGSRWLDPTAAKRAREEARKR